MKESCKSQTKWRTLGGVLILHIDIQISLSTRVNCGPVIGVPNTLHATGYAE